MPFVPLNLLKVQGRLEVFHQSALSRACISTNGEDSSLAASKRFNRITQFGHLHFSAGEIRPEAGKPMGCLVVASSFLAAFPFPGGGVIGSFLSCFADPFLCDYHGYYVADY